MVAESPETLTKETERDLEPFEEASVERQNTAYKRFSMIAGIIPVIGNKSHYTAVLDGISKTSGVSKQTIRKYLCEYLVFQDSGTASN
jgi:hypothetical protein